METEGISALVTGGASGLGEATVRRLVAGGARVVIADVDEEKGKALAGELGGKTVFVQADVTQEEPVIECVKAAEALGPLRVAVNCAGIGPPARVVSRDGSPHPLDLFRRVIDINLVGTFNVLRCAAAAMVTKDGLNEDGERGVIINTASIAAWEGQVGQAAYAASKGGIVGLTLAAARDLASVGIRVVSIAPGMFDTPLFGALSEEFRAGLSAGVPYPKRMGQTPEFAALVEHIITNRYINGETIRLDAALRMPPK